MKSQNHKKLKKNEYPREYWNENKNKIFNNWKILGVDNNQLNKPVSRQLVNVQCIKCGHVKKVIGYSIKQGTSKQCNYCKVRKWKLEYVIKPQNKEIWKLNMIWRKYKKDFCSEWKTNFNAYAKFLIEDLGWKSGQYRISKKNKKEPLSPKNVKLIKK
jgi:hypothetical protein